MSRNYGIMPSRSVLGGNEQLTGPVLRDAKHARNSNSVPSAKLPPCIGLANSEASNLPLFVSSSQPLKRGKFLQSLIDITALLFGALFVCSLAASLPLAVFIFLFVR